MFFALKKIMTSVNHIISYFFYFFLLRREKKTTKDTTQRHGAHHPQLHPPDGATLAQQSETKSTIISFKYYSSIASKYFLNMNTVIFSNKKLLSFIFFWITASSVN